MNNADFPRAEERNGQRPDDAGAALHAADAERRPANSDVVARTWHTGRDLGRKFGLLAKTKPLFAIGIAAGAGLATGVFVGARVARLVALIAAGYALHGLGEHADPLWKAGIDRLVKAIAV
jgi:hypothetical protein